MSRKKTFKRHKRQKTYYMKGCSRKRCLKGGNAAYPNAGGVPFIGTPIMPSISGGCNTCNMSGGNCGGQCSVQVAGKRKRKSRIQTRKLMRGGFVPESLINLNQYLAYSAGSVYNGLMGHNNSGGNPMPYVQPALSGHSSSART